MARTLRDRSVAPAKNMLIARPEGISFGTRLRRCDLRLRGARGMLAAAGAAIL
jgi:hypothetical protein